MLITFGTPEYLRTLLLHEAHRDDRGEEFPWSQFLSRDELDTLLKPDGGEGALQDQTRHTRAVECLTYLSGLRSHHHHRRQRTQSQLKATFLRRLQYLLIFLILGLLMATWLAADRDRKTAAVSLALITAFAGALGSTVTGVFKGLSGSVCVTWRTTGSRLVRQDG